MLQELPVIGSESKPAKRNVSEPAADKTIHELQRAGDKMPIVKGWRRNLVDIRVAVHIFRLAVSNYRSVRKAIKVLQALYLLKESILGGISTKIVKVNGLYHHYLYAPGYPSKAFDTYIEAEFNRIIPVQKKTNILTFIIFAITRKCPLQCEHCFEWKNLNGKESLTLNDVNRVIVKFQQDGIAQFHLSGGEPMVRIKDLVEVIAKGDKQSEFYVLTSGFNFTRENARALKTAGLTGVVISLDHFEPEKHNTFRGFKTSYSDVLRAVYNAQEQNLVITLSLCTTRAFTTWENLIKYAELAKKLNVPFIQLLEPKAIGQYEGKDVFLSADHFSILEKFYQVLNFDPAYSDYPIVVYHGYHLRRVGCFSGGNRMLYIDSQGYVNACPFCSTKTVNIRDAISENVDFIAALKSNGCQQYKNGRL